MPAPVKMRAIRAILAGLLLGCSPLSPVRAAPPPGLVALPARPAHLEKGASTGLPLPRFVSLVSGDVNMRVGPGFQYPIKWVYHERGLPVMIEREFEVWRLVLAPDGGRGWMHEATLSGTRTFLVSGRVRILRRRPEKDARAIAVLKVGVIGRIHRCKAGDAWCSVVVDGRHGYLRRTDFWGTFPDETVP
ncbi:MAG: SH3 domain-containing protein [Acetobacteraceae bacterium]